MRLIFENLKVALIKMVDNKASDRLRKYYKDKYKVDIGKYTYGYSIRNIGVNSVIGPFCSIASGVKIWLMNHPMNFVSTGPFAYYSSRGFLDKDLNMPIESGAVIEADVWIGNNAVILPNVIVKKGAVIGAGAVVTKDVQPYEIVGGVPAKHIKWRFEDEKIRKNLYDIKWEQWDDSDIKKRISDFYDPIQFIEKYKKEI